MDILKEKINQLTECLLFLMDVLSQPQSLAYEGQDMYFYKIKYKTYLELKEKLQLILKNNQSL